MPIIIFTLIITTLFLPPSPIPPTHPTLLSGLTSLDWTGTILLRDEGEMTDTLARNNQYPAGMIIAECCKRGMMQPRYPD